MKTSFNSDSRLCFAVPIFGAVTDADGMESAHTLTVAALLRADLAARIEQLQGFQSARAERFRVGNNAAERAEQQLERAIRQLVALASIDPDGAARPWIALSELAGHRITAWPGRDRPRSAVGPCEPSVARSA